MRFFNRNLALRAAVVICAAWAAVPAAMASDLEALAALHGAPGAEEAVAAYVRERLGAAASMDNTGSLTVSYGEGFPHWLIAAGLDEPGYAVSEITDEGFLRLQRLADPLPNYQFDTFFRGQPLRVTLASGKALPAVAAVRSVHFAEGRAGPSSSGLEGLYVDIGASSRQEAAAAGVRILDRITLEKEPFRFGETGRITAPWISSRAGAAALLLLARRLAENPPPSRVTLAFFTQQHYYNAGLTRVLERVRPQRVVVIRPGGAEQPSIAAASGWSSKLQQEIVDLASGLEIAVERSGASKLSFGPFGHGDVWPDAEQSAVLTVGVENEGTPVETLRNQTLADVARLLEALIGCQPGAPSKFAETLLRRASTKPHPPSPNSADGGGLAGLIAEMVRLPGVSGSEAPVREWIRERLPRWAAARYEVDEKGNLIVRLGKEGPPKAVFIAHMDEIGYQVSAIAGTGIIRAKVRGGGSPELFAWHPIRLHGSNRREVAAIMTNEGVIDAGFRSAAEAEAQGVAEGSGAAVPKRFRRLLGSRVTARALDDRAGCAVLLSALQAFSRAPEGEPVWLVFSVEEEVGLLGAAYIAKAHAPERVYAVDSFVTSDSPLEATRLAHARLGEGAVVRALDNSSMTPRAEVERIAAIARRNDIPLQIGVTAGGNDGSTFVAHGAVNVPLTFPLRYSHSPAEVADTRDLDALLRLVSAVVEQELSEAR